MIGADDFYNVMCAMVPLYVAMFLAYGSVKWWRIFTPDQCAGINRFVAVFAVPVLSFHFISHNNPYKMDGKFIMADSISKIVVLTVLGLWTKFSSNGSLEWMITLFSLATLPNTLVMGIPLLRAMYGDFTESLMVQLVVLQCIIWYTLLLFLFEYRGARLLVTEQFPDIGASIVSFKVDGDVVSLDGREPLQTEAEVGDDGKIRVKIRRSTSSRSQANGSMLSSGRSQGLTPRPSNLTGAEIYSVQSSRANTPGPDLSFNHMEHHSTFSARAASPRHSNLTCSDVYSLQSSRGPTPRTSNFSEDAYRELTNSSKGLSNSPRVRLPSIPPPSAYGIRPHPGKYSPIAIQGLKKPGDPKSSRVEEGGKEFHMFVWSAAASPVSEAGPLVDNQNNETRDVRASNPNTEQNANGGIREPLNQALNPYVGKDFSFGSRSKFPVNHDSPIDVQKEKAEASPKTKLYDGKLADMPRSTVMLKLILTMVGRKLARNPNTYSSLLGLLWSLISFRWHFGMPSLIKYSIKIISDAGLGMAMFSLGLFMALQPRIIACGTKVAAFGMAVRFLTGPAIMSAASIAVGLRGVRLHTAIVQAALPQGIVPFVFAREYGVHPDILSTGVIFGMLISLPITLLYYILLGL